MPHLVKVDKKYRDKGLRIIAAEVQGSSKDAIEELVEEHKMKFSVTSGVSGPVSVGGIPHAIVFGADGKIVFNGHPASDDFEKAIKTAVKDVKLDDDKEEDGGGFGKPLIAERTWTNSEGKPLVAAVTEINGNKVIFKLKNGRKVPYDIDKLSEEDQKVIEESKSE